MPAPAPDELTDVDEQNLFQDLDRLLSNYKPNEPDMRKREDSFYNVLEFTAHFGRANRVNNIDADATRYVATKG
jgi:hypothetical protein